MSSHPIRLLIHGASGRMGRALIRLAAADPRLQVVAAVSRSGAVIDDAAVPSFPADRLNACPAFDIAVDFSLPEGFDSLLAECVARQCGLVSGTTGLGEQQVSGLAEAGCSIPVLWASNFSLGVAVLEDLARRAAAALHDWQVELTEIHHVHKKDAPSGTALTLARALQDGGAGEPSIRSLREGEVIGIHRLRFSGPGETLELAHEAGDRDIFARGALDAARLLAGRRPGSYRFADLLFGRD
jgi:4-hydroxy-tetrahydrodipicolinate reductase